MTLEKHRGRCPNTVLSLRCWRISCRPGARARGWLLQRCSGQRLSLSRWGIWTAKKVFPEVRTVVSGGRMIYGERNVMSAIKLLGWWSVAQAARRACPNIPEILSLAHLCRVRDRNSGSGLADMEWMFRTVKRVRAQASVSAPSSAICMVVSWGGLFSTAKDWRCVHEV